MAASFDLVGRPWLDVTVDGRTETVGLRDFFHRAHRFDDIAVTIPPAATGLWRILYAVATRITGLDDPTLGSWAWTRARTAVAERGMFDPDRVDEYFDRWSGRFDLFDPERPWLQDPRLREQCAKTSGVNKLTFDRPAGSNQVWFNHVDDARQEPIPSGEAVLHLIAQLYFGPSGRCTTRVVGSTREANTAAGPLRQVLSYHPIGRTVFETLLAGIPGPSERDGDLEGIPDECPWEADELPDPLGMPRPATWPGGMLTGRNRHAVLLVPDTAGAAVVDSYVTWGWRTPATPQRNPFAGLIKNKEGQWYARRADADRALWRDLDSLLKRGDDDTRSRRPSILADLDNLPFSESVRIRAFGFDQDGQTRDRQWFVATTPPILAWMEEVSPDSAVAAMNAREAAERVERQLEFVLREAAKGFKQRAGQWPAKAASYYWPRAEEEFWRQLENPADEGRTDPTSRFIGIAAAAIDHAIGSRDQMPMARAHNEAQRRLRVVRKQGERR